MSQWESSVMGGTVTDWLAVKESHGVKGSPCPPLRPPLQAQGWRWLVYGGLGGNNFSVDRAISVYVCVKLCSRERQLLQEHDAPGRQ
ncbi:hypothetical protein Pmani_022027 [Petrolisthes manimaculis]|uniref:Uncharacterized protein n=1 Tax=Petrolisthes manimaculis TaxID=1843537 RepID=A0AAE1PDP9_9EUCA|nr:hypothetical protein Pmani_022027 [Petrolisthes manimaculis]